MSMPPEVVSLNIGLLDDQRLDSADLRDWIQPLYQQASAFPLLSSISWETSDGKAIWIARYPGDSQLVLGLKDTPDAEMVEYVLTEGGGIPEQAWRSFAYDPREWGPYQAAAESTKPMWADPVDWVDEQGNVTAMALPYVCGWRDADGRFHGAVTGQFTLNDLSDFLASLPVSDMTQSYVTDQSDRLLGTSMTNSEVEHLVASTAVSNSLIAGSAVALRSVQSAGIASPWEGRLEVAGTGYLTRVSSWQHPTGLRLRIVTLTPEKRMMAEISQGRQLSFVAGLATAGLAALVGMALAVRLLRPVLAVQRHVARVGAGDFDTPLELTLSPEFVELSTAINQMSADLKDREALRYSLSMAMQVQQSLLPSRLPEVAGIDIAAHSAFCDQTGGDYYDFLELKGLGPGELAIVVGDVMGHGIASAMLMATARGALHSQARQSGELHDLLRHLNELLAAVTEGYQFMTMLTVVIDPARRRLRWASAGHGEPLVFDPISGDFVPLAGGSLPLGVESGEVFEQYSFDDLRPGMILIAATDGLWEARRADGEQFGMQRVRQLLRDHASQDARRITAAIVEALAAFVGDQPAEDDVTFVVAKIAGDKPR
jgi:sigma-B regulation protein RsbU (phosphoserine phosphatase)